MRRDRRRGKKKKDETSRATAYRDISRIRAWTDREYTFDVHSRGSYQNV
jgi:hypothetical protein